MVVGLTCTLASFAWVYMGKGLPYFVGSQRLIDSSTDMSWQWDQAPTGSRDHSVRINLFCRPIYSIPFLFKNENKKETEMPHTLVHS